MTVSIIHFVCALVLAPLLPGIANRVKAFFGGRQGPPLFQAYYDIGKLLRKGVVYSVTTTAVFRWAPIIGLAAILLCVAMLPCSRYGAPIGFSGDLVLFVYLLALARFVTVLAALDTGSSFEGMGASREVAFAALSESAFLIVLATLAGFGGDLSVAGAYAAVACGQYAGQMPVLLLVAAALFILLLSENCRVPVDDPNTHLELTMIHEVMVLDYSGPDLGMIFYAASLKLWIFAALIAGLVRFPVESPWLALAGQILIVLVLAAIVGCVESLMARLRFVRVPQLLLGAFALAATALIAFVRSNHV
jgi:formate hydrogenlyase subunit 4